MITQIPPQNTRGLLETQPWKSSSACYPADCCSAVRSSHCPWAGRKEGTGMLPAWCSFKGLIPWEGAIHNKNTIQHHCCSSSNTLFEKLISHGICTLVSWSLTVLRNCVKGPEAPFHHSEKATAPKNEAWSSCKYIWRNKAIFANVERKGRNCRFCFVLILFLQHYEKAITLICKAFTFTIAFNKI